MKALEDCRDWRGRGVELLRIDDPPYFALTVAVSSERQLLHLIWHCSSPVGKIGNVRIARTAVISCWPLNHAQLTYFNKKARLGNSGSCWLAKPRTADCQAPSTMPRPVAWNQTQRLTMSEWQWQWTWRACLECQSRSAGSCHLSAFIVQSVHGYPLHRSRCAIQWASWDDPAWAMVTVTLIIRIVLGQLTKTSNKLTYFISVLYNCRFSAQRLVMSWAFIWLSL